jgi:exonuclease SbcC
MVLPQGEVAKFLMDDSGDRETLLSALFGGDIYDRIARALDEEAKALHRAVGSTDEQMRHHLANAIARLAELHELLGVAAPELDGHERDGLDDHLASLEPMVVSLRDETTAASEHAEETARIRDDASAAAQRFDDAALQRITIHGATEQLPSVKARAETATTSQAARPVVAADDKFHTAVGVRDTARMAVDERRDAIKSVASAAGIDLPDLSPVALTTALNEASDRVTSGRQLIALVSSTSAAVEAAAERIAGSDAAQSDLTTLIAGLTSNRDTLEARLFEFVDTPADTAALDAAHEGLTDVLSRIKKRETLVSQLDDRAAAVTAATTSFEEALERYVATEAPRLAERLEPGQPCAVCGAIEHPAPAVADGGAIVSIHDVEDARRNRDRVVEAQAEAQRSLDSLRAELGQHSDASVDDITEQLSANREAARMLITAIAERGKATSDLEATKEQLDDANTRANQLIGARPGLDSALIDATAAHDEAVAHAADVDQDLLDTLDRYCTQLTPLLRGLDDLETALITREAERAAAEQQLSDALEASGFTAVKDARGVLMPPADETAAISALEQLNRDLLAAQAALDVLEKQGIPAERPDTAALGTQAHEAAASAHELTKRLTRVDTAHKAFSDALATHDTIDASSSDLRARAAAAHRASQVCRGQGAIKVNLRRWVLGRELDRVTDVASVHLGQMTGGRYSIRRVESVAGGNKAKGLDLEVLDAHTGRPRKPNSLSGGEQFQASLALALAVADVVSHGGSGSGQRIEALFVDEGFGSLDPRALDDAIETLHQLHASGRMVGAITHVEAMKERLHPGIVVSRLPDGRGSTLTVNP